MPAVDRRGGYFYAIVEVDLIRIDVGGLIAKIEAKCANGSDFDVVDGGVSHYAVGYVYFKGNNLYCARHDFKRILNWAPLFDTHRIDFLWYVQTCIAVATSCRITKNIAVSMHDLNDNTKSVFIDDTSLDESIHDLHKIVNMKAIKIRNLKITAAFKGSSEIILLAIRNKKLIKLTEYSAVGQLNPKMTFKDAIILSKNKFQACLAILLSEGLFTLNLSIK